MSSLKKDVFSGLFWKFSERILAQLVSTIVSVILARLLLPEDYGAVSIVLVFINIANTLVTTGLGQALIQDSNSSDEEFSTLFYCSVVLSVALYLFLFLGAPFIARFYNLPILNPVLRILGLKLLISGVNTIQQAYVSKTMQFRKFFYSTLGGTLFSGIVGLYGAYHGWGVWALVAQYLSNSLIDMLVLFLTIEWKPKLLFSWSKAKKLLAFGGRITCAELVNSVYNEFRALLIGKSFSSADLAFFNKGEQFPKLICTNVNTSIISVLFPAISKKNDHIDTIKSVTRKAISTSSFFVAPIMFGFAACAEVFISLLLTEKWLPAVPFLRIACFCYTFVPINSSSIQAIKAIGASAEYLKMETLKKTVGLLLMLVSLPFGVYYIALVRIPATLFESFINTRICRKHIGYTYKEYFMDIKDPLVGSTLMYILLMFVNKVDLFSGNYVVMLVLNVIIGALFYLLYSFVVRNDTIEYLFKIIKKK